MGRILSVCVVVLFAAGCRGADHHPDSGAPVSTASTTPVVPSTNPPAEAAPAHLRCHTSNLSVRLGRKTPVFAEQYSIPVVFTNHSDRPCSMVGFPGVDLQGPPDPEPTTSLTRAVDSTPRTVDLPPGGAAHSRLTYLLGPGGSCSWIPHTVVVTPPDETTQLSVAWPGNPVDDCQAAATHPGTYIGPVEAGSG